MRVATFDVSARLVMPALPIAPEFVVGSKVTETPNGIPLTRVLADEVPVAFVAVALNEYVVPFVRPRIRQLVAGKTTVQVADGAAVPEEVVATTSDAVLAKVKVVGEGTEAIV